MNVVDTIGKVQTDANDKPLEDVEIIKAELVKWRLHSKEKYIGYTQSFCFHC